ncbi:MAG: choice-of-anchor Q domain-containing protein, partial [Thermomicrobiales bacterium]
MRESRGRLIGRGIVIGLCAVVCVITLAFHTQRVAAAGYTVTALTDTGTGSGTAGDLRYAITQVNAGAGTGDTITFSVTGTITLGSALPALNKNVAITGPTGGAGVTVQAAATPNSATYGVFVVNSGVTASIANLTIANGNAANGGSGGGIGNRGTLTVTSSTLSGNSAQFGGGIYNAGGTLTVTNSTLSANSTSGGGGGILNNGTLTVTNSTLAGNSAGVGGGIGNYVGTVTVTNSTLTGNSASNAGGGGISNNDTVNLTNTIVAGNTAPTAPDISGPVTSHGHNLIGNTSGSTGIANGTNGDIVNPMPLLAPLGAYGGPTETIALLPGSPAIDVIPAANHCGTGDPTVDKDQRGVTRPVGAHCDIGAFESQGFILTKTSGDNQRAVAGTTFTNPLVVTVTPSAAGAADNEPVNGGVVTFTAIPNAGASATLTGSPATITGGQASVTARANTTAGSYSVTASAAGAASVTFSLMNSAPTITLSPTTLPSGVKGVAYPPTTITAAGGTASYAFTVTMGTLPTGLTLSLSGVLSGTPTVTDSFTVTVTATDANGFTGSQPYTIAITAAPLTGITLTPPSGAGNPPSIKVGQTEQFTATGTYADGSM